METVGAKRIGVVAAVLLAGGVANWARAAIIYLAPGEARADSQFRVTPAAPTDQDVVQFFDPFDRRTYTNVPQYNRVYGMPYLVIDPSARTIDLLHRPGISAIDDPYFNSGLAGNFGRLSAGEWTYRSLETHTFTVVPEPAGLSLLAAAAGLALRRRRASPEER